MTSESTRFLGQPNEMKPTVGAVGVESLLTLSLYREMGIMGEQWLGAAQNLYAILLRAKC